MQFLQGRFCLTILTFIFIFKSNFVKFKSHINANFARRLFLINAYIHIYIQKRFGKDESHTNVNFARKVLLNNAYIYTKI